MQREALHDEHRCNKVMHECYCDCHTEHRIIVPFTQTYEKYPFAEWNGLWHVHCQQLHGLEVPTALSESWRRFRCPRHVATAPAGGAHSTQRELVHAESALGTQLPGNSCCAPTGASLFETLLLLV